MRNEDETLVHRMHHFILEVLVIKDITCDFPKQYPLNQTTRVINDHMCRLLSQ